MWMINMDTGEYMKADRLNAFYDAIIAIIVTILVLELPQPEVLSIAGLWQLKLSYLAYIISFLVCVNMWQYHHKIFNHVNKINNRIIWLNILLMLIVSIIPYLTLLVADNFNSALAQMLYGIDFILVDIILFVFAYSLLKHNPESEYLKNAINVKYTLIIPLGLFFIGFIIAFMGYPPAISILCLLTVVSSIINDIK